LNPAASKLLLELASPLFALMGRDDVRELVINTPGQAMVEGDQGWTAHAVRELTFEYLNELATAASAYTKQDIGPDRPLCATTLPGDYRCQIVMPPAVPQGTVSFTIRKPAKTTLSLEELDAGGLFNDLGPHSAQGSGDDARLEELRAQSRWREFFEVAIRARKNILISGATGSGKTTFSKGLIAAIPADERLVTIEDSAELVLPHQNAVRLFYSKDGQGIAKIGPKDLLEAALRMRPDRILLQELRDGVAWYYLRNVNSGHPGSITTIHANSAALAFEQMMLLIKESDGGREMGRQDIRALLELLINIVVHVKRVGGKFRIMEVHFRPRANNNGGS